MSKRQEYIQGLKIVLINLIDPVCYGTLDFAIGLLLLQKTGSAINFGLSLIVGPIVGVILFPVVGPLIDHFSHKRIIVLSQLEILLVLLLFVGFFSHISGQIVLPLIGLLILLNIGQQLVGSTFQASLINFVSKDNLPSLNSGIQVVRSVANIVSPLLGAMVYGLVQMDLIPVIVLVGVGISMLFVLTLKFNEVTNEVNVKLNLKKDMLEGFAYLKEHQNIFMLVLILPLINFFVSFIDVGVPFIVLHVFHLSKFGYGLIEAAFSVGMVLAGVLFAKTKIKKNQIEISFNYIALFAVITCLMAIPAIIGHGMNQTFLITYFILGNLISGVVSFKIDVPAFGYLQLNIPENFQGRVFNLINTISPLVMPLGVLLAGFLYNHFNSGLVLLGSGLINLVLILISIKVYKQKVGDNNFDK
ncbi:MFS transporter [Pediococcus argentinicus]|uniref:MFS transporter n=1 Tax=Pediococcus argentinicus TaxID=480391 RepID=UPI0007106DA2|nr:MFS transporter [Pediococcus argentinicus]NKZ21696.1 MFS transporter [Pediococcus argentinicus]GEP18858.1 MFS transporter [Pediococcus argentinicus]